jgi:hypothetical protein
MQKVESSSLFIRSLYKSPARRGFLLPVPEGVALVLDLHAKATRRRSADLSRGSLILTPR